MLREKFSFKYSERMIRETEADRDVVLSAVLNGDVYNINWFDIWEEEERSVTYTIDEVEEAVRRGDWIIFY